MFANYLIGLREGLEAALVVGIVVAYLVRSGRHDLLPAVWKGVGLAIAISLAAGAALTFGPRGLSFEAQETIGGVLSLIAVGFVTWMILWMARTSRALRSEMEGRLDLAIGQGGASLVVLCMFAVGREGLETALFLWAAAQATDSSSQPLIGGLLGLITATALGVAIHRGAVRLNLGAFFRWTGGALVIVAAGVASYGIHDLQEAGILPGLGAIAFDVSGAVPPGSWYGTLLKGTVNFSPRTTWLQLAVWFGYLVPVMTAFVITVRRAPAPARAAARDDTPAPAEPIAS